MPLTPLVEIRPGRAIIDLAVVISFQRFPEPTDNSRWRPPKSFGALPCGLDGTETIIVPVAAGEAIWIAIEPEPGATASEIALAFELLTACPGGQIALAPPSLILPPMQTIDGVTFLDGTVEPIVRSSSVAGRHQCGRLRLSLSRCGVRPDEARVTIELVSTEVFRVRTGRDPGPALDLSHGYDGRLLP